MLCRVALVITDVSEELIASFIVPLVFLRSVRRLLVTARVPSSPILVDLMKEALSSSETSVLTRASRRNPPEDATLHSHRRENLKSYAGLFIHALVRLHDVVLGFLSSEIALPVVDLSVLLYSSPSIIRIIKLRRMR
jgi:hypothetical protein